MAYVITDSCVNCGTCEGECPVELSLQETANMKSTLLLALIVEHVLVPVLQELSSPSNMYMYK